MKTRQQAADGFYPAPSRVVHRVLALIRRFPGSPSRSRQRGAAENKITSCRQT